ncbi:PerC family transcriptional regulator [Erwiniaceae bacterium L1_54_6]|nr:PerC family transcriptional regulator [Erwiniaceae bacterium L1_54_6]
MVKDKRSLTLICMVVGILSVESILVIDKKAEELEAKGFFRRAAARWAEVARNSVTDDEREQAVSHQKRCLRQLEPAQREPDGLYKLRQAASKAEKEMGIDRDRKGRLRRKDNKNA